MKRGQGPGMVAGLVTIALVVALELWLGERRIPVTAVVVGPLLTAALAPVAATAAVGMVAVGVAFLLGILHGLWLSDALLWRVAVVVTAGGLAVWLASRRVRREAQLTQAQTVSELAERLGVALEAGELGAWDWDVRTGAVEWSRQQARMFGVEPEDLGGTYEGFAALVHPDDRAGVLAAGERSRLTGEPYVRDFRVCRPDGGLRWVTARARALTDDEGRTVRLVGVVQDRTEARTLAERVVRTLETTQDAFFALDTDWRFAYVNARAEEVWRRPRSELLGRVYWDEFPTALGTAFEQHYREAAASGEAVTFEAWGEMAQAWLEVRVHPVPDGLTVYFRDVTARRAAEEARAAQLVAERRARTVADRALDLFSQAGLCPEEIADIACRGALDVFECSWTAMWQLHGDTVHLAGQAGRHAFPPGTVLCVDEVAGLRDDLARRRPRFIADVTAEAPESGSLERARRVGAGSALRLPIVTARGAPALLAVAWPHVVPPLDAATLLAAERFADQVALAVEQARTGQAQAEAAALGARLQAGLLPTPSLRDSAVQVASVSRPGERRMLLGGDFLDAVELPDGTVAFAIGDVTGHGPRAAALGTTLRAGWRALALAAEPPAALVAGLDAVLRVEESADDTLATVCCGWLAPDRRGVSLVLAGHPPPVLLTEGGVAPVAVPPGLLLGWDDASARRVHTVDLPEAWALLCYTDGLVEARLDPGDGRRVELGGLLDLLARIEPPSALDAADLEGLLQGIEQRSGQPFADDVALLLIRPTG